MAQHTHPGQAVRRVRGDILAGWDQLDPDPDAARAEAERLLADLDGPGQVAA